MNNNQFNLNNNPQMNNNNQGINNQNGFIQSNNVPLNVIPGQTMSQNNNYTENNNLNNIQQTVNGPQNNGNSKFFNMNPQSVSFDSIKDVDLGQTPTTNNNFQMNNMNNNNINNQDNHFNVYQQLNNNISNNNIAQTSNYRNTNFNNVFNNNISTLPKNGVEEEYDFLNNQNPSKFIQNEFTEKDTTLQNLKTEGIARVDYTRDPRVHANLAQDDKRKKTVSITTEGKVFIVIIIVLLLAVFVIPYLFDLIMDL